MRFSKDSVVADDSSSASEASAADVRSFLRELANDDRVPMAIRADIEQFLFEASSISASPDATEEWTVERYAPGGEMRRVMQGENTIAGCVSEAEGRRIVDAHRAAIAKLRKEIELLTDEREIWKRRALKGESS